MRRAPRRDRIALRANRTFRDDAFARPDCFHAPVRNSNREACEHGSNDSYDGRTFCAGRQLLGQGPRSDVCTSIPGRWSSVRIQAAKMERRRKEPGVRGATPGLHRIGTGRMRKPKQPPKCRHSSGNLSADRDGHIRQRGAYNDRNACCETLITSRSSERNSESQCNLARLIAGCRFDRALPV